MVTTYRILIIDDDADFRASVGSLLEAEGYQVMMAGGGHEGLELARARRPDLIILDVMMESATEGYVVNQSLKFCKEYEGCADTPIIMCSSIEGSPDELFPRAEEVGMIRPDVYLPKPLELSQLLHHVHRLLPHPAQV